MTSIQRDTAPEPELLAAPTGHELLTGPTRADLIRRRAYALYEHNGCVDGRDVPDWLTAETEVDRLMLATAPV